MELVITPRTISSDNRTSVPVVFLTWLVVSYTFACANRDSVEKTWGRFLNEAYLRRTYLQGRLLNEGFSRKRLRERFITFASAVANVILGGRMYLRLK